MGDNCDRSYDSRWWGPVPLGDVQGRVLCIAWSRDHDGTRWERFGQLVE
jgi:signal peptidase I